MANATSNPNLIADLVAIAMDIPSNADDQMIELKALVLQLPGVTKAEREEAAKRVKAAISERDEAVQKLHAVEDEVQRLREEVRAFENQAKERNGAKRKAVVDEVLSGEDVGWGDGAGFGHKPDEGRNLQSAAITPNRRPNRSEPGHRRDIDEPSASHDEHRPMDPRRSSTPSTRTTILNTSTDPRRTSTSSSFRISIDPLRPSPRPAADSYTPAYKKPRTSTSSGMPTDPRASISYQSGRRHPVCGSCKKHRQEDLCDGGVSCNRCRSADFDACVYHICRYAEDCTEKRCTFLHSDQWDRKGEMGMRKVVDMDGRRVSGHGL